MVAKKSATRKNYIKKIAKEDLIKCVGSALKTPPVEMTFSCLKKPFYYPGVPIPRYSVTCIFNLQKKEEKDFLSQIEKIAELNEVDTIGVIEDEFVTIKFQSRDCPKLFITNNEESGVDDYNPESEPERKSLIEVTFDLKAYHNVRTGKKAFNFCPKAILFHTDKPEVPKDKLHEKLNKNRGNRPKLAGDGIRHPKLRPKRK